jgi:hypothetical protein
MGKDILLGKREKADNKKTAFQNREQVSAIITWRET